MAQLFWITNNHCPLRPVQEWKGRSDVALARFVDNEQVKEARLERDPSPG